MDSRKFQYALSDLRTAYKYLGILIILSAAGILYYSYAKNVYQGIIAMTVIALLLLLTKNLWTPKEYRKPLLTYFSLGGFWMVATAFIASYEKTSSIVTPIIAALNPVINSVLRANNHFGKIELTVELLNTLIIIILIVFLFLVNYIFRKNTILLPHPTPLRTDLPD